MIDKSHYPMRAPCPNCGKAEGVLTKAGPHWAVFCRCSRFQYYAPKIEVGEKPRTNAAVRGLMKPSQKSRVRERDGYRCLECGRSAIDGAELHVDHIIPLDAVTDTDLTERDLNSDDNLITLCSDCNLGKGKRVPPLHVLVALFRRQLRAREPKPKRQKDGAA